MRGLAELAEAKVAAAYLYADDADPLVWRGLEARGVDYETILDRTGPLLLRTVSFDLDKGRFMIDELGEHAYVQAVHSEDNPEQVVDVLAWSASRPHLYGTYLGYAGLLGGDAVLNPASFRESPCPIWTTPLALLQTGLRGTVVLAADLAAPIISQALGKFQCENEDHARWLVDSGAVCVENLLVPRRVAA
jgi:hypothetical protein